MWNSNVRFKISNSRLHFCHIHNRVPVAPQLPDLLGIYLEQQRCLVTVGVGLRLDVGQIQRAPRSGVDDPHQSSLRVAVVNVKDVHSCAPYLVSRSTGSLTRPSYSSSSNISESD